MILQYIPAFLAAIGLAVVLVALVAILSRLNDKE